MRLSKRQIICFALLGAGLAALAVDRLALTPASAAGAEAAVTPDDLARPAAGPAHSEPAQRAAPGRPLAARVAEVTAAQPWTEQRIPDGFRPSMMWLAATMMGPPVPQGVEAPSENKLQAHKFTGVFGVSAGTPTAIIDRQHYHEGDTLDGYVIRRIDSNGIDLHGSAGTVRLSLAGPERPSGQRP